MRLVTFQLQGKEQIGVWSRDGKKVCPTSDLGVTYRDMNELIEKITPEDRAKLEQAETKTGIPIEEVTLEAPIPAPRQDVICLGINYMAHAEESARYKKEAFGGERPYAVYFSKRVNRAVGPFGEIDSHPGLVEELDYEAELAAVIGRPCRNVAKEDAWKYIFGYTVLNDVSARKIQTRHKQWYFGKSLDGFTPMGPCILTADEVAFPPKLQVQSYVNGELRQDSSSSLLIFGLDHIISELSAGMTLLPGTIISTGTPAGAGMGFEPPRFLKPGDTVECRVEKIGSIINRVR